MVTIEIDIPQVLALVGVGIAIYYAFRRRLHRIREAVDAVDDALYDDKVTEQEFRKVYGKVTEVFRK